MLELFKNLEFREFRQSRRPAKEFQGHERQPQIPFFFVMFLTSFSHNGFVFTISYSILLSMNNQKNDPQ